jgi:hypothetical protein
MYTYDPAKLKCTVDKGIVDIDKCTTDKVNNVEPSQKVTILNYLYMSMMGSVVMLILLPNIFSWTFLPDEKFHLIDTAYLGITNGILALFALQYINVRRSGFLLSSFESAAVIMYFILLHFGLRSTGLLTV